MPVGTKATVKTLDPDEVRGARRADRARQHLPPALPARRRADRRARRAASLHGLGRPDPDRLGRLPGLLAARHDRSPSTTTASPSARSTTGRAARFTPELAAEIQARLGSDIAMCLDQVPPPGLPRSEHEEAVGARRSGRRGRSEAPRAPGQLLFGIAQGGVDPELRRRSVEEIAALDFDGNAIGGLSIGEEPRADVRADRWATPLLPPEKPRYFMGIGDPQGILEAIERGRRHVRLRPADPHRAHRIGADEARAGSTCATRASPATSARSEDDCPCPACSRFIARVHPPSGQSGRKCSVSGCSPCIICVSCSI